MTDKQIVLKHFPNAYAFKLFGGTWHVFTEKVGGICLSVAFSREDAWKRAARKAAIFEKKIGKE